MSRKKKIGYALLGAGMIADYHARGITASADIGANLIAVGYHNPARFAEIESRFGAPCRTEADLLADPQVDAVCICTPSGQHAQQAIAAARAGKHVFVEKPMAIRLDEADVMIAACQQAGVLLGVAYQSRTKPIFQHLHAAIQAGDLGDLTLGMLSLPYYRPQSYYDQADWRGTWRMDGGGVLMNQGIHQLDLLVWYFGDPSKTHASARTLKREIEVEDTLSACLEFPAGAQVAISATTTAVPGFPPRLEIYGSLGGVQVEGDQQIRWQLQNPAVAQIGPFEQTITPDLAAGLPVGAGAGADPRGISFAGHISLIRDFTQAIQEGRPPLIDGQEGRRSVAMALGIYQAAGLLQ